MTHLTTTDARKEFAEIINRAAFGKERFILTRRGRDLVAVVPIEDMQLLEKLIEQEEDNADIEAAEKALVESDERIPYEKVRLELGL